MQDEQHPDPTPAPACDAETPAASPVSQVTRSLDLDAGLATVWDAVADPERRGAWLDDEDAITRTLRIDHVDEGRSLTWTWWRPDDDTSASQVHVELTELADGSTRITVTERLLAPTLYARAGLRSRTATTARLWDRRVFGLELLLVAAGVLVG
jgi:uncharacterized protein YndB with AHSA1/START domain